MNPPPLTSTSSSASPANGDENNEEPPRVYDCVIGINSTDDEFKVDGKVLELDDSKFDSAISSFDYILVDFYAPWCRHCKDLSHQEDDIFREQISLHGTQNWGIIASKFKDKRRWYTYLNSDFKKGGWSPEEDVLLCESQKIFANRWTEIAKVVSGRARHDTDYGTVESTARHGGQWVVEPRHGTARPVYTSSCNYGDRAHKSIWNNNQSPAKTAICCIGSKSPQC